MNFLIKGIIGACVVLLSDSMIPAQDENGEVVVEGQIQERVMVDVIGVDVAIGPEMDANIAKQSFLEEMTPLVKVELGFAFRVCKLSPEEKAKVRETALAKIPELADIIIGEVENPFGGVEVMHSEDNVVANTASGVPLNANPYIRIEVLVNEALSSHVSAEQLVLYKKECELRDQYRREAAVGLVMSLLDAKLALTDDQYETIQANLNKRWQKAINISFDMYRNNSEYLPQLPPAVMQQGLNKTQLTIWNGLSKYDFPLQLGTSVRLQADWDE